MIKEFFNLSEEEQKVLIEAPAYITILVAGSDHNIDEKELEWASKLSAFRSKQASSSLNEYYSKVEKIFGEKISNLLITIPDDFNDRNKEITAELKKINDIFPKIESSFANELYKSFLTFAEQVARASGGILGIASISPEEKKMIKLEMIKPPVQN